MKTASGKKAKNTSVAKRLKTATKASKKGVKLAKKKATKLKVKSKGLLKKAKMKLNNIKKTSAKSLSHTKDAVYAKEQEIEAYVKANPVKSVSAVALTALIAGFISSRYTK